MTIHIALHFIVPGLVVGLFFRQHWKAAYPIMAATMLVDLDHLLANPIYDPGRCSIGYHPLHGFVPIVIYVVLCFLPKTRYVGIGLVIHMALDSVDCQYTNGIWCVEPFFPF
jgi:Na+/proline symporter